MSDETHWIKKESEDWIKKESEDWMKPMSPYGKRPFKPGEKPKIRRHGPPDFTAPKGTPIPINTNHIGYDPHNPTANGIGALRYMGERLKER